MEKQFTLQNELPQERLGFYLFFLKKAKIKAVY